MLGALRDLAGDKVAQSFAERSSHPLPIRSSFRLLSAAILFSGALPANTLRLLEIFRCASIITDSVFAVRKQLEQEKRPLVIGGDAPAIQPSNGIKKENSN